MKEMKTQLILFSLLLLGSTAWAQQPCLSQDAYREKVEAYSQILKQQKLKTLASSEAAKDSPYRFPAENRRKQTVP